MFKKMSEMNEHDIHIICSHHSSCDSCPLYKYNCGCCYTYDNTGKLVVVFKDSSIQVPNKEGNYSVNQGRLF